LCRKSRVDAAYRGNHCHSTLNEIGREGGQSIVLKIRPAEFDRNVLPFDIAGLSQPLTEGGGEIGSLASRPGTEVSDHRDGALLCADRPRAGDGRAAQKGNESASVHFCVPPVTTSSCRH